MICLFSMANEATLVFMTGQPIPFTVADATAITKGALLKLTDPMTAILATAANDACAGIAAADKIANDGVTKLAVYREGIFKVFASGSVVAGSAVKLDPVPVSNYVSACAANEEDIFGIALEDATVGQSFLMELGPTAVEQA